ncbi:MAG: alpha/beta hydrolase [Oligoflexia bacterium]|nr:alpha/beta hydrolase [Oligoflexia bacterium]
MFFLLIVLALLFLAHFAFKFLWAKNITTYNFANINDQKIHYKVTGPLTAKPILLIHGIAANIHCWRHLTPLLIKDGFCVFEIDLLGFGFSDKPLKREFYSLKAQANLLGKFIDLVIKKPAVICANSMGGNIALELALRDKQNVESLILISPAYDAKISKINLANFAFLARLLFWMANPLIVRLIMQPIYGAKKSFTLRSIKDYLIPYLINSNAAYALMCSFDCVSDLNLKERIKEISAATLILWGKNDFVVSENKFAKKLSELIANSELKTHPAAGHHLQEEEPEWILNQINTFILGKV